jgi:hypothetical protein
VCDGMCHTLCVYVLAVQRCGQRSGVGCAVQQSKEAVQRREHGTVAEPVHLSGSEVQCNNAVVAVHRNGTAIQWQCSTVAMHTVTLCMVSVAVTCAYVCCSV